MTNRQGMMNLKGLYGKLIITIVSLMLMATPLLSNNNINRNLGKSEAIEDLSLYFKLIDEQHGNPYQYISRSAFLDAIETTINQLPDQIDYKSFELELAKLNNLIRCGHTTVNLDTKTFKAISNERNFFPLPVSIINNKVYVDFEQSSIPHGATLLEINGHIVDQMLPKLRELTVTDGFSEAKRSRELESRFGYYLFLSEGPFQTYDVKYLSPTGEIETQKIQGVAGNQMIVNNYYRPLYQSHERYYHFTHLDAIDSLRTVVLTLNTFQANPNWFYEKISSRYNEESRVFDFDHLVLDLRNNEGGDRRILNFLYEFFTGSKLSDPSKTYTRTLNISNQEYLKGINGNMSSPQIIGQAKSYLNKHFNVEDNGIYRGAEQNWHETFDSGISWDGIQFEGEIYVLTSGKTFSAAADFARILSQLDHVTLVGEETGGAHVGRTANMLLNYSLPNSNSMVQIPVIYEEFINANHIENAGRGTFPDYYVTQSFTDLMTQQDAPFNFTLELIQDNLAQGSN